MKTEEGGDVIWTKRSSVGRNDARSKQVNVGETDTGKLSMVTIPGRLGEASRRRKEKGRNMLTGVRGLCVLVHLELQS